MLTLWTPTDWNEEARLRIEYLNWKIEHNELPCLRLIFINLGLITSDPEQIMQLYQETGVLFYNSEDHAQMPSFEPLTFEEWRELHENSRFYGL